MSCNDFLWLFKVIHGPRCGLQKQSHADLEGSKLSFCQRPSVAGVRMPETLYKT